MQTTVAYILIILGVAIWSVLVPLGRKIPPRTMRGITIFGAAYLLAISFLSLVPEAFASDTNPLYISLAILAGFLLQQLLDGLSAHIEHGHTEEGYTFTGLIIGLSLHAFMEGMPLVSSTGDVNHGLTIGIVLHNIPVALILVGLMMARGYRFWRVLAMLVLFGFMSPLGSLFNLHFLPSTEQVQHIVIGLVVGVLLHVSSSILFDHRRSDKALFLTLLIILVAFAAAFFTI